MTLVNPTKKRNPDPLADILKPAFNASPEIEYEGVISYHNWNPEFEYEGLIHEWKIPGEIHPEIRGLSVWDSPDQMMDAWGNILDLTEMRLCVFMVHIPKTPEPGGWRWHKWGPYMGEGKPQHEYLADEEGFEDGVWTCDIYGIAKVEG